jgi:hypothetical protein
VERAGYAALQIIPSFDGMESRLERGVRGPMTSAGSKGGRLFGDSAGRSLVSSISTHAKHAAFLAAGAFSAAAVAGGALLRSSFAEARESQKVAALTTATIESTGGAANVTAKEVDKLSFALGKKAGVDDELVASGANMLLTFKNIRNEAGKGNKIFDRSLKVTTDLAARMAAASGGELDLKSASIQVGKALNDPIKGITALSRVGVSFTDQQKEQIKTLVEHGDTLKAQKIILRELNSENKGAAESQRTLGDQVEFTWGNIEERLGTSLLPLLDKVERKFLKDGVPAVEHWLDVFQDKGVPALKHFYDRAEPIAEDVLPKLGSVLGTVKDDLVIAAPYAKDLVDAFAGMPDWAKKAIVGGGLTAYAGSKLGLGSLLKGGSGGTGGGVLGLVSKARPLPVFVVNEGFGPNGIPGLPTTTPKGKPGTPSTPLLGAPILPGAFPDVINPSGVSDDELKRQLDFSKTPAGQAAFNRGAHPLTAWVDDLQQKLLNIERHKIQPKFDILGLVEADAKITRLQRKAERPIVMPIVAQLQNSIGELFDFGAGDLTLEDLLAGGPSDTGGSVPHRRSRGNRPSGRVTVNIGSVQPHNYRDFMGQMQQRSQMAQLDGIAR